MKIGPNETPSTRGAAQAERPGARKSDGTASGARATEPSAQVALSSTASALAGQDTEANFDAGKVERIAQAIRDGKFQINADAIADKLIANAQELLERPQH